MELDYIREFVVLAKIGGFQRAADELFISQSSLSQHIKRLESQLNAKLFDRSTSPIQLTAFGKAFFPYAERLTKTAQECTYNLSVGANASSKTLRIGSRMLDRYKITNCIVQFRKHHPDYSISMLEEHSKELKNALRKGACDVAIIRQEQKTDSEFTTYNFYEDQLVLVLPDTHPLANSHKVPLEAMKDEVFLMAKDVQQVNLLNRLCRDACRKAGFEAHFSETAESVRSILSMIQCGMGVAILSNKMVTPPDHVSIVELEKPVSLYVNFLFSKEMGPADPGQVFLDFIESIYS